MKTMLSLLAIFMIVGAVLQNGQNDTAGAFEVEPSQSYETATTNSPAGMNQPQIGYVIEDELYLKAFFRTEVYSDGVEGTLDPESVLWMQLALDDASLLEDSKGTSVTKREYAHRLNMPWKVTGNL